MIEIRQAKTNEFELVRAFYHTLIETMKDAKHKPGWKKGVYPTDKMLLNSLQSKTLHIGTVESCIVSAMVLDHECVAGYTNANWQISADKSEIMVVHALGIGALWQGKGIAKQMMTYAATFSKKQHCKAIRLDVLANNTPALQLYPQVGFKHMDTIQIFYEDTGLADFLLFELLL